MSTQRTLSAAPRIAKRNAAAAPHRRNARLLAVALALSGCGITARAADGCTVLLCLAAPNWRAIAQCVPPVVQVLRDLAKGRPFPVCGMGGAGNTSAHAFSFAPGNCPPHYTREVVGTNGPLYVCDYIGAISVVINGGLFTRTWWQLDGDTVTDFSPAAKAQLGTWHPRFDDEYAAWLAKQPPAPPTETH